jgi:hypothetical protein
MLPSLCRLMASIPSVSRLWSRAEATARPRERATVTDGDCDLASMPLAGSIGTRFVARLYSEGPLR